MVKNVKWEPCISTIAGAIGAVLKEQGEWNNRFMVAAYVDQCVAAGFCKTENDMRLCAERYLSGKRKVTPPGTARRKKQAKERNALLNKLPPELLLAVKEVVDSNQKAVLQYKDGNEKAINSLVGQVIKTQRFDAATIRELILGAI